jgi:hypothetical protein
MALQQLSNICKRRVRYGTMIMNNERLGTSKEGTGDGIRLKGRREAFLP